MRLWEENPFCFVCEKIIADFSEATLEHIVPIAFGGRNSSENIALSHKFCNELKGSLVSKDDRKKKLKEHEQFYRMILWRRFRSDCYIRNLIQEGFENLDFVIEETHIPKKDLKFQLQYLMNLRKHNNLESLIEASKIL